MRFKDRIEAGSLLAVKLKRDSYLNGLVLAVPRGGVPVAYQVANELGLPLELVLIKKIGHPSNKEYAIGAASLSDYFVIPHEGVSESYIQDELLKIRERLKVMKMRFMGDRDLASLEGKNLIVVDDGIATGNTLMATIKLLKKSKPLRIVIAVPVTSREAMHKLSRIVDEVVAVMVPLNFHGVGAFYEDFGQVTDEEVLEYLNLLKQSQRLSHHRQ
ncbi:MAG: phosphoribosyltransferase [Bacteroidota bacterium]|nr:phosphoribosyltransferase [Bacteroidota bacterium]